MEAIKFIGVSICVTTVATSIFSMLMPNSKLDKVLKFAISLFFLAGVVSPFINNKLNFHITIEDIMPTTNQSELALGMEKQFLSLANRKLETSVSNMLNKIDVFPKKVEVIINITENDSISINKMMVYIDKKYKSMEQNIKNIVKDATGCEPKVIIEE